MDRFLALTVFANVVEQGSFARAASRLSLSASAVSRHVADLEAHLDTRLLNRTTRRLSLTESGQTFYERCVQLLADLGEAEEAVSAAAVIPRGTLKLTCSITFGIRHIALALAAFSARHPQIRFDVELSDRAVDIVDEGIDLAIRIGDIRSRSLIGRKIGVTRLVCCAAPAYLAHHPAPKTPADLAAHACLSYEYARERNTWRFFDGAGNAHDVRIAGPAHANNGQMLCALAVAGMGISFEPDFIVAPEVRAGHLVLLLPDYTPPSIDIYAAYPSRRHLSAKVRTFVDFLVARFATNAEWAMTPPIEATKRRRPA
jgi:DNA-binding transcriptional LysR family regulator